jgi:hypothetical protein
MIVPTYWSEARKQHRRNGKQVTIRRFGWSDISESEAAAMAESRASEALARRLKGQRLPQRDQKVAYGGASGIPIREEILGRQNDVVITRNGYGARCLNTPDVLFADVDFQSAASIKAKLLLFFALAVAAVFVGGLLPSRAWVMAIIFVSFIITSPLADLIHRLQQRLLGGPEKIVKKRILRFLAKRSTWNLRLYRTPAGLRILATHQPFLPTEEVVQEFFRAVGADPVYVKMCLNQHCFRARLTAKPWRIGIRSRMKPRPGVWPVRPERMAERAQWIATYEEKAKAFASCTFLEAVGSGAIHPKVAPVIALHDKESRATIQGNAVA